jgi:hypothetical protein
MLTTDILLSSPFMMSLIVLRNTCKKVQNTVQNELIEGNPNKELFFAYLLEEASRGDFYDFFQPFFFTACRIGRVPFLSCCLAISMTKNRTKSGRIQ